MLPGWQVAPPPQPTAGPPRCLVLRAQFSGVHACSPLLVPLRLSSIPVPGISSPASGSTAVLMSVPDAYLDAAGGSALADLPARLEAHRPFSAAADIRAALPFRAEAATDAQGACQGTSTAKTLLLQLLEVSAVPAANSPGPLTNGPTPTAGPSSSQPAAPAAAAATHEPQRRAAAGAVHHGRPPAGSMLWHRAVDTGGADGTAVGIKAVPAQDLQREDSPYQSHAPSADQRRSVDDGGGDNHSQTRARRGTGTHDTHLHACSLCAAELGPGPGGSLQARTVLHRGRTAQPVLLRLLGQAPISVPLHAGGLVSGGDSNSSHRVFLSAQGLGDYTDDVGGSDSDGWALDVSAQVAQVPA
jgi:hypothetical protein